MRYLKVAGHIYEMRRFEDDDLGEFFGPSMREVAKPYKTLYSHVVIDSGSRPEWLFAEACENNDDVLFYIKLPRWFVIETPVGKYNPDWALAYRNDKVLYFVAETKSTGASKDPAHALVRVVRRLKIACGKQHFGNFEQVQFRVVGKLEELVS